MLWRLQPASYHCCPHLLSQMPETTTTNNSTKLDVVMQAEGPGAAVVLEEEAVLAQGLAMEELEDQARLLLRAS